MQPTSDLSNPRQLLDDYPLIRSRSTSEARDLVGRALSPHRLHVRTGQGNFEARHNRIRLDRVSLNVLSYGAEVEIDPGERGDYYLLQLPLQGRARLRCNGQEAWVNPEVMSVLPPRAQTRMVWSGDCAMIMLQVPSAVLHVSRNTHDEPDRSLPAFSLTRSRHEPAVAAWWQAVHDMTGNLHSHGALWLRHRAAFAAMETFLLTGLDLLRPAGAAPDCASKGPLRGESSRLQRAVDHIHAHVQTSLSLASIAAAACMSPRALESAFRRRYESSPLAYARCVRLDQVHIALQRAAKDCTCATVTDLAMQHGFFHMGRFAACYLQRFGCSPSVTLRTR